MIRPLFGGGPGLLQSARAIFLGWFCSVLSIRIASSSARSTDARLALRPGCGPRAPTCRSRTDDPPLRSAIAVVHGEDRRHDGAGRAGSTASNFADDFDRTSCRRARTGARDPEANARSSSIRPRRLAGFSNDRSEPTRRFGARSVEPLAWTRVIMQNSDNDLPGVNSRGESDGKNTDTRRVQSSRSPTSQWFPQISRSTCAGLVPRHRGFDQFSEWEAGKDAGDRRLRAAPRCFGVRLDVFG